MSDAVRGLYSMLSDKGLLSYGPGRCFFGPTLDAAIPDPLDLTDLSWLPEIGHSSDLGRTQGITIKPSVSKIELKTADDGERPADKAISAHDSPSVVESASAAADVRRDLPAWHRGHGPAPRRCCHAIPTTSKSFPVRA